MLIFPQLLSPLSQNLGRNERYACMYVVSQGNTAHYYGFPDRERLQHTMGPF